MTRGSRILKLCGRLIAVSVISLLVLTVAFEIYLRQAGFMKAQPAIYPCVAGDPVLNHVFFPNCQGVATAAAIKSEKDVTYQTNDHGYRGHAPEPGKRTLVVIGDSYTEGFGLTETEAFPAVLEGAIRVGGAREWQVLNGGTLGFSPALYPAYFDRNFLLERPELVLLNLDFSDFNDDAYFLQIADYDGNGRPVAFPGHDVFPQWMMGLVYSYKSAVVRFVHQEMNQWSLIHDRDAAQYRMDQWIRAAEPLVPLEELRSAGLGGCVKPIEAVAKNILVLKAHAAAVGSRFAIHMYPPGGSVKSYSDEPQNISFVQLWDARHRRDFSWACGGLSDKIVDVMRGFAGRQGIPFFDSFPLVMGRADRASLYYDHDAHWNSRGVKLVASDLAKRLLPLLGKKNR